MDELRGLAVTVDCVDANGGEDRGCEEQGKPQPILETKDTGCRPSKACGKEFHSCQRRIGNHIRSIYELRRCFFRRRHGGRQAR